MVGRLLVAVACVAGAAVADPFATLGPGFTPTAAEREALARGEIVAHIVPARRRQVAAFAATRVDAPPEALVVATRRIADLKKSRFVESIGRFSDPPQLSDLDQMHLAPRDVQALLACDVGNCSFKLSAIEIEAVKRFRYGDRGGDRVTAALKQVLLERVIAYRAAGSAALPAIANRGKPWQLHDTLAALQAESPPVMRRPPLDAWFNDRAAGEVESFIYWSQEFYGAGKPVILITHVAIDRPSADEAIVAGKQIFSSRYMNGAISLLAVTTGTDGAHYLTYLNRTSVDLLGGVFGPVARAMLESEIHDGMPDIISGLRRRLERSAYVSSLDSVRDH